MISLTMSEIQEELDRLVIKTDGGFRLTEDEIKWLNDCSSVIYHSVNTVNRAMSGMVYTAERHLKSISNVIKAYDERQVGS